MVNLEMTPDFDASWHKVIASTWFIPIPNFWFLRPSSFLQLSFIYLFFRITGVSFCKSNFVIFLPFTFVLGFCYFINIQSHFPPMKITEKRKRKGSLQRGYIVQR